MATLSHDSSDDRPRRERRTSRLVVSETWTALTISVIWVVVLLDALFGPDIVTNTAGATSTTIPSAVVVAFFAYLATLVVARHGFGDGRSG